ncbi:DUF6593 domain-containing protein [Pleurotus pulmonarius]
MAPSTFNLFFTGRDDPRHWVIIGEDTKPVLICFETPELGGMSSVKTTVFRNDREHVASFEWAPGNHLGRASIGRRYLPMSQLVAPTGNTGRCFTSADGQRYEWRPSQTSYNLYAPGPAHGILQYTFSHDLLLLESLLALSLNRWIDIHGM